jgi:elongator complex protein 2
LCQVGGVRFFFQMSLEFCSIGSHTGLIFVDGILYNSGNFIASDGTRKGHSDTVTCLANDGFNIVSGSNDKTVIVWEQGIRIRHQFGISCVERCKDFVIASDVGRNLTIWKQNAIPIVPQGEIRDNVDEFEKFQLLKLGWFVNCIRLVSIAGKLVLFLGGTDCLVHIYILEAESFNHALTLSGHTDWITGIDVIPFVGGWMVASSSQDKTIRVWSITRIEKVEAIQDEISFDISTTKYSLLEHVIYLETVLVGHEGWVTSVAWMRQNNDNVEIRNEKELELISASIDAIMVWKFNGSTPVRLGNSRFSKAIGIEANGIKKVYGVGMGGIYEWESQNGLWIQNIGSGGHTKPVTGVSFDPTGSILISVSSDQTTRVYVPFKQGQKWKEIARPQIHGYDINCLSFLDKYRYVSGSDEKVLRVFEAPKSFVYTLANITGAELDDVNDRVDGAQVPALGLSNKAIDGAFRQGEETPLVEAKIFSSPPLEEELQKTLWPEIQKLYGHGFEIVSVSCTPTLIASSSKATQVQDAVVRLWSVNTWNQLGLCEFHSLTVTAIQFSHCGRYLLTGGRDRAWAVFDTTVIVDGAVKILSSMRKAHARIIWSASWSHDDAMFATGSRDKSVKIWDQTGICLQTILFKESVTSVAFHHNLIGEQYVLAVGLENGNIEMVYIESTYQFKKVLIEEKSFVLM